MLNDNKIEEIKLILEGLRKDIEALNEMEMISHLKWEELLMSASLITHKLNTLRIEQERNNMKRYLLKEEALSLFESSDQEFQRISLELLSLKKGGQTVEVAEEQPVEVAEEQPVEIVEEQPIEIIEEQPIEIIDEEPMELIEEPQQTKFYLTIPVEELRDAITLNDRLLFIRELFDYNQELYATTIERLNSLTSFEEAIEYCQKQFPEWEEESDSLERFNFALKRRFDG